MLFDMPVCLLPELILHWTYAEISLQKCSSEGKPIDLCSCIPRPHDQVRIKTNWGERREKNLRKIKRKRKEKEKGRKERYQSKLWVYTGLILFLKLNAQVHLCSGGCSSLNTVWDHRCFLFRKGFSCAGPAGPRSFSLPSNLRQARRRACDFTAHHELHV